MAEIKEFVINDRRKFTAEGELRPEAQTAQQHSPEPKNSPEPKSSPEQQHSPESKSSSAPATGPQPPASPELSPTPDPAASVTEDADDGLEPDTQLPTAPTAEQSEQAKRAFDATVDRLDTAIRATNPGMERPPEINLQRVIQSLYMQALMQLGGAAAPGQQPQVDLLGARQTIDMLGVLSEKTRGNCTQAETTLLETALFELRIEFLEVTQALSRSAAARQPQNPGPPTGPPMPGMGPRIVR